LPIGIDFIAVVTAAIAGALDRSQHTKSTRFIRSKASAEVFHKFKIGQQVEYSPPRGNYAPRGTYLVTKLLPERDGEFEYFIRSTQEAHERIAKESELRGAS
jgi:hypothetical protein